MKNIAICPCCNKEIATEIHHIMHGNEWYRAICEKYPNALLMYICHSCHSELHREYNKDNSEKNFDTLDYKLKVQGERAFAKYYPSENWMHLFGKKYDTSKFRQHEKTLVRKKSKLGKED